MTVTLREAASDEPGLKELVAAHKAWMRAHDPAGTDHTKSPEELAASGVTMLMAWRGQEAVGMGGLYGFAPGQGEVKSVFVRETARGLGLGRRLTQALISMGEARGFAALWLETGTHVTMAPARKLYESLGFVPCAPFAGYVLDPSSAFYRRDLRA